MKVCIICNADFESLKIVHGCGDRDIMYRIASRMAANSEAVDVVRCLIFILTVWLWAGMTTPIPDSVSEDDPSVYICVDKPYASLMTPNVSCLRTGDGIDVFLCIPFTYNVILGFRKVHGGIPSLCTGNRSLGTILCFVIALEKADSGLSEGNVARWWFGCLVRCLKCNRIVSCIIYASMGYLRASAIVPDVEAHRGSPKQARRAWA